jgi:D-aspartate ligase
MEIKEREFMPVILGADITAYSLARSYHEEYGIKSLVLSQKEAKIISLSKIIENRIIPGLEKEEVLITNLLKIGKEFEGKKKLIVMGCGDWYVRILIENKDKLSPYYVIPYIDEDLLNQIVLKDKFYEFCEELKIQYPKTYVYECGKENNLQFEFDYPVIAKPANSALYHYAKFPSKKKVFRFKNKADLKAMLDELEQSSYDYKFLIQDCIPGDDEYMRVLTCYSDRNGKVKFAALGHSLLEDHNPSAIGNPVAIINEVNPDIVAQATKFLEHIGYTGFSNFDIKYDKRNGTYNFFEINVRLGRSNFYVTGSGFNTVKWIVDDLIYGKDLEYTVADKTALFTVVPKGVILHYVHDKATRAQIKKLYKEKKVKYPLYYKGDLSPKRWFYVEAALLNQYRKYYKVEKAEKQRAKAGH